VDANGRDLNGDARQHSRRADVAGPFRDSLAAWLALFRRLWSAHVDALERHLDRTDQSTPTKRKARRRRRQ